MPKMVMTFREINAIRSAFELTVPEMCALLGVAESTWYSWRHFNSGVPKAYAYSAMAHARMRADDARILAKSRMAAL